jgi:hypothetical protein
MFGSKKYYTKRINDLLEQIEFLKNMVKDQQSQIMILSNKNNEFIQAKDHNRIVDNKVEYETGEQMPIDKETREMQEALSDILPDLKAVNE